MCLPKWKADGAENFDVALPLLLGLLVVTAVGVHVARYWRPLAFVASVAATLGLVWAMQNAGASTFELFGVSFAFQPLSRDYVLVAFACSGVLAIATSFDASRRTLGFLYWSWIVWLIALLVDNFVVGVFAWAAGLATMVLAMEPRRLQRVGGAAYYLVLIIVAGALLLLGNRFAQLYPLMPDQISLIDSAVLFLTWGLGLMLAAVPFSVWLGPMADETPPPNIAVLLGFGQPIGLWLLYSLIGQYPRLLELSNLVTILNLGGIAAIAVGGVLCALERRAGRFMSFAALYVLGFALLDLARSTPEGMTNAVLELFTRALGLTLIAASVTVGRAIPNRWVNYVAVGVFILGALTMAGIAPGVVLATRWNLLLELEATDARFFYMTVLATMGILIGAVRFVMLWLEQLEPQTRVPSEPPPAPSVKVPAPLLARLRRRAVEQLNALGNKLAQRFPPPLRRGAGWIANEWRAVGAVALLLLLALFVLYYSATPNFWSQRALESSQQLYFLR